MKVVHCQHVETGAVQADGADGVRMCCLIGPDDRAPSFSMRYFEVAPGGHTPKHAHAHEHEVFVLEGSGAVVEGSREHPIRAGSAILVAPNELHQFRNTGGSVLKFLCFIPHPLRGMAAPCVAACGCEA